MEDGHSRIGPFGHSALVVPVMKVGDVGVSVDQLAVHVHVTVSSSTAVGVRVVMVFVEGGDSARLYHTPPDGPFPGV